MSKRTKLSNMSERNRNNYQCGRHNGRESGRESGRGIFEKNMIQTSKGRKISRKKFQTENKYIFSSRNLEIRKSSKSNSEEVIHKIYTSQVTEIMIKKKPYLTWSRISIY